MLSVLIVNWNTRALLGRCIESIQEHAPDEPFEIVVVDNDSGDGSADMVGKRFPDVRLIRAKRNTGYAHGNNLAFAAAAGDLLLTLNPDTEFFDGSLQKAVDLMRARLDAGALGARLLSTDGRTQASVRGFPTVIGLIGDATGLGRLFPRSRLGAYRQPLFDYDREQDADQPMGTFLLFRKEALASVGDPAAPFDEGFPIFFNEVDLLYRLKKAGWKCLYSPDVRVRHHGGESTRQVRKSMIWESHRSLVRYLRKHHGGGWRRPALALLGAAVSLAAFVRAKGYDAGFRP